MKELIPIGLFQKGQVKYFRRDFIKNIFLSLLGLFSIGGVSMSLMKNENKKFKKIKFSYKVNDKHWVGDGFYVHGLLRPSDELNKFISPFILMDYASPKEFSKTTQRRGVGEHPHRGFETVTLAYQGEIEHRDSSGGGGVITAGGVQWMTAGSGVVHDEFHSGQFSSTGGIFEMVQLWVNLPKKDKMTKPKYQGLSDGDIPKVKIAQSSSLRVIAGEFDGVKGPSSTFTPINMYDLTSESGDKINLKLQDGSNTILLIMSGQVELLGQTYDEQNVVIFEREGEELELVISKNFKGLILNGEPIDEPMVAHGPFVMNTKQEIIEAINDFQAGKMGRL